MTNTTNAALARYEAITRRPRTALAYAATAVRLEIAAKSESGERATKLRDRAADCRARADRARAGALATKRIPVQTLAEIADEWRAELARRAA